MINIDIQNIAILGKRSPQIMLVCCRSEASLQEDREPSRRRALSSVPWSSKQCWHPQLCLIDSDGQLWTWRLQFELSEWFELSFLNSCDSGTSTVLRHLLLDVHLWHQRRVRQNQAPHLFLQFEHLQHPQLQLLKNNKKWIWLASHGCTVWAKILRA